MFEANYDWSLYCSMDGAAIFHLRPTSNKVSFLGTAGGSIDNFVPASTVDIRKSGAMNEGINSFHQE
jgi:hypothetical protein